MRIRRYLLLGAFVAAALVGLGAAARGRADAVARERAGRMRDLLRDRLEAGVEHARFLARSDDAAIGRHLHAFRGLARVRRFDAAGRPVLHVERYGDLVARKRAGLAGAPPAVEDEAVSTSGFRIDDAREDVHPSLRQVVDYAVRQPDGGTLVLTLYAAPFLQPLRDAGANLIDADGRAFLDGPRAGVAADGPGWRVVLPADAAGTGLFFALGALVLLLAAGAVLGSERQLRAQERAALERRLAQSERLSAIGLLAAGIAHEINNPLEGIMNWLQLGDSAKAREGFERIRAIVRDLLAFARPAGEEGVADVRNCFARALDLARYARAFRDVDVEESLPGGLAVSTSPRMLEQVLLNLLLNAGAAMEGRASRRVEVTGAREGPRVRIEVRDHGPGIAPADLPRVFDPFFSRGGGTGLGLSVSYGMVKAAGGDLRASNDPAGGARFAVELPGT